MRVIVADDESVSRNKLQEIMEPLGKCDFFEGGRAVIEAFQESHEEGEPYQLLMLDIGMPDVNGIQVLHEVRRIEKEREIHDENRVKVIMVTAHPDKDTIITFFRAGCDSYIKKPFDRELIFTKLEELGFKVAEKEEKPARDRSVRENVAQIIERFKKGDIDLPVLPKVVQDVDDVIRRSGSTIDDLSRVIEKDAVISAQLVATANSTLYNRGGGKFQSLKKAISLLGFKETQAAVVAIASKSLYETKNKQFRGMMEKLRLYSLASAHGAASIAKTLGLKETEKYFLMGLIHDMGNVLLLWMLGQLVLHDEPADMNDIISSIHQMHTAFGAALLQRWKFPEELVEIARMHEGPEFSEATGKDVLIVNLAGNLAFETGYGFIEREDNDLAGLDSAKLLELDANALEILAKEVQELVEHSESVF
jgi:two-component system chemotaxis response regulator CheY